VILCHVTWSKIVANWKANLWPPCFTFFVHTCNATSKERQIRERLLVQSVLTCKVGANFLGSYATTKNKVLKVFEQFECQIASSAWPRVEKIDRNKVTPRNWYVVPCTSPTTYHLVLMAWDSSYLGPTPSSRRTSIYCIKLIPGTKGPTGIHSWNLLRTNIYSYYAEQLHCDHVY